MPLALIFPLLATTAQTDAERAIAKCNAVNTAMEQAMAWQGLGQASMADNYAVDAAVSAAEPWCMGWSVLSIARRRPSGDAKTVEWVLRYASGVGQGKPDQIVWATARNCPAVLDAIEALSSIKLTIGFSARIRPSDKLPQLSGTMDGTYYTVRSIFARQPDDTLLQVEASGNTGAIRAWYEKTMPTLASCWQVDEPSR